MALSYAGEDRVYVQKIAALLQQRDVRVFYDEYAATELWEMTFIRYLMTCIEGGRVS